jgi:hypothetical protein
MRAHVEAAGAPPLERVPIEMPLATSIGKVPAVLAPDELGITKSVAGSWVGESGGELLKRRVAVIEGQEDGPA